MPSASSGLLIVRVWVEPGSPSPLRAEVRLTTDVLRGVEEPVRLTDAAAVLGVVEGWLQRVVA